jgi:lipoate-protein ligase B
MERLLHCTCMRVRVQVWVGEKKIGALGVQFSQGVSTHGAALNVDLDTGWFRNIIPCGEPSAAVTTVAELLRSPVDVQAVQHQLARRFARECGVAVQSVSPDSLLRECGMQLQ